MSSKSLLRKESNILVTGGGRGITAACIIELSKQAACRFIIIGRTNLDTPEPVWAASHDDIDSLKRSLTTYLQQTGQKLKPVEINRMCGAVIARREIAATLDALRNAGSDAEYISADAADLNSLRNAVEAAQSKFGRITGIIHGAGSLADKRIENKTLADFRSVFDPKVQGLANLLECIPPSQLDFLALFSSVVSVSGNPGQTDYGLANRSLDVAARRIQNENPACRVISINWGPWESGMVSPALKEYFNKHGVNLISLKDGAKTFISLLLDSSRKPEVQIIAGSLPPRSSRGEIETVIKVTRTIRLSENPFLLDHVIGGNPVLPATCAAAWMAHSAEQVYPGMLSVRLQEFKVLKGLVFSNDQPREFTTEIRRTSSSEDMIEADVTVSSQGSGTLPLYHYSAHVTLSEKLMDAPQNPPSGFGQGPILDGPAMYQDGTCFHGPAFQGIQKIYGLSQSGLSMDILLPTVQIKTQGQFPVRLANPYLNDVIVQSLLVWTQKVAKAPCLPSYARSVSYYAPLAFDTPYKVGLVVQSITDTSVVGDITVWDVQNHVVMQINGLQGTISPLLRRLIPVVQAANG